MNDAEAKGLAAHENYMFAFHDQLEAINEIVKSGEIGDVRLYRISFGFPMRAQNDFRYNKALGGGALLDCGGYTLKYASMLLGPTAKIKYAQSNNIDGFNVDMYGSAALVNDEGVTAQVAFGMDHNYKCELEVWGSKGTIYTNRILTAPAGFVPEVIIRKGNEEEKRNLPEDDAFKKSILHFSKCIEDAETRKANYETLLRQARLVEQFKQLANIDVK
jgi:predicted dehydrogenase